MCTAFVAYVGPFLEYWATVWSPSCSTAMAMNEIGSVQQPKKLARLWNFSYDKRLSILWLERLELLCFKIVKNLLDIAFTFFLYFLDIRSACCHHLILVVPDLGISVRSIKFAVRVVQYRNSLPAGVISLNYPHTFKCAVKKIYFSFTLISRA